MIISSFSYHVAPSFSPPCFPCTTCWGIGGKYLKQVSNGNYLVEVWTTMLSKC
jgi:hypothetical protein